MESITTPFNATNAIWGCSVYVPYIPHRDPKNPAFIPIPDPVNDPYWLPADLPHLVIPNSSKMVADDEPNAIITEATLPSANSEAEDVNACNVTTLAIHTPFHLILPKDMDEPANVQENENSPIAEGISPPTIVDTFADAGSNTAVRSPSPIPSIRTPDRDSMCHSSLPSGSIITVIEDWLPAPIGTDVEPMPVRPATAFENRKLDNVIFDCGGHMNCTNNISRESEPDVSPNVREELSIQDVFETQSETRKVRRDTTASVFDWAKDIPGMFLRQLEPAVLDNIRKSAALPLAVKHVDDFETATQMPVSNPTVCDQASQTQGIASARSPLCYEQFMINVLGMESRSSVTGNSCVATEETEFASIVATVTQVYDRWGLSPEDAYVDVITGFHRVGSPSKRLCLGIKKRQSPFVIALTSWTPLHTKLSIYVDHYCAFCETMRDDQIMKILKDTLWAVFNGGKPLSVIVMDSMVRELPAGKYQVATVEPLDMLKLLVEAWGAEYKYMKSANSS